MLWDHWDHNSHYPAESQEPRSWQSSPTTASSGTRSKAVGVHTATATSETMLLEQGAQSPHTLLLLLLPGTLPGAEKAKKSG